MGFEEVIRGKIAESKSPVAKSILKVVLGEFQQKNAGGRATENDGYSIIEKIISGNKETLGYFKADDPRREKLEEENVVVGALLPPYLSQEEVLTKINADATLLADVKAAKGDGQAVGVAVKWFKTQKLDVKGDTVKAAVAQVRTGG